jgi:site-specific DNA recombinase
MGRLTLNLLLSFAQFEREITGERIRDKIAASKERGMWMGGNPPLGHHASGRTLVINLAEAMPATSSRYIFSSAACAGSRTKRTASGSQQRAAPQQMASSAAASRSRADTSTGCSRTRFTPVGLHTRVSSTPASIRRS